MSPLKAKAEAQEEKSGTKEKQQSLDTNFGVSHGLALSPQKSNSYWWSLYG